MPKVISSVSTFVLTLVCFASGCADTAEFGSARDRSRTAPELHRTLDSILSGAAMSYGTAGYSVAILRRGELVYVRHAGSANLKTSTPISAQSAYPIYSISKLFLLVALFQSAERGELNFDMPIGEIRADLPEAWRAITLRQAISHVSGLPEYLRDIRNVPPTADAAIGSIRTEPLRFLPGTRNDYNQTNFLLAREALERATGQPLVELVSKQFKIANMTHSRYRVDAVPIKDMVTSYEPAGERGAPAAINSVPSWPSYTFGSSGIVTTLDDMVSWTQSLLNGDFLPMTTLVKYWQPQSIPGGRAWHANGWNYDTHNDVTTVGHAGSNRLIWRHTYKTNDPADSVTVIYLDNGGRTILRPARLASLLGEAVMPGSARRTDAFEEMLFQRLTTNRWNDADVRTAHEAQGLSAAELEIAVNTIGYDALFSLGAQTALLPMRWNAENFHTSANAHDSLGEVYREAGNLSAARDSYGRALALDQTNERIKGVLRELDTHIAAARRNK